jgi:NAD(P)-dependent dehydrogenase (short-subunit alcohol dehydrogenase family)
MDLGLNERVVLVTGGARDIGREIVLTLAREGAAVAVNYQSSTEAATELVGKIESDGGRAKAYQADVSDYGAVETMIKAVVADFGRLDGLVNNAGYVSPKAFIDTAPEEWHRQIDVGLYAVLNCCHVAARHMQESGGRIVNIAGDSARVGERGLAVTAASRGGVLSLTKSLAKELGRYQITVNAVALGLVETSHSDKAWLEKNMSKIVRNYPLGRIGVPQDVAPAVAFLASEGARWITGQIMSVSGGYSMAD